jgi:hypothetical protein
MARRRSRSATITDWLLTAALLVGLLLLFRWAAGTIGGELNGGGLLLALTVIVVSTVLKMVL